MSSTTTTTTPNPPAPIRPRERDAIIQSLRAGVVPRTGQQHIQVGRVDEVKALLTDLDRIVDGGSGIRFIIGEFGSGKTFFLYLIRSIALEKKLVTVHADLNPDRRLHATGGQARALYQELVRNLSTRSKPDGGALASVVERFVTSAIEAARERNVKPDDVIRERLASLAEMVNGYDFGQVIAAYWKGHDTGNETLRSDAVRWLRGEFATRTDARAALGVRTIIDDGNVYDQLKLLARFVRLAGFAGLLVCCDELVNLYKMANTKARNTNYEQILRILNDSLQGSAEGLAFLMGGTPEFLLDTRKGLYSYPALQSRLAQNLFLKDGLVDYTGPVLRLANLSPEDLYVLLGRLRHVYASGDPQHYLIPDEGLQAFMQHCAKTIGDAYFRTPRNTVTAFVNLLAILEQNPGVSWLQLLAQVKVAPDMNPDLVPLDSDAAGAKKEVDTTAPRPNATPAGSASPGRAPSAGSTGSASAAGAQSEVSPSGPASPGRESAAGSTGGGSAADTRSNASPADSASSGRAPAAGGAGGGSAAGARSDVSPVGTASSGRESAAGSTGGGSAADARSDDSPSGSGSPGRESGAGGAGRADGSGAGGSGASQADQGSLKRGGSADDDLATFKL